MQRIFWSHSIALLHRCADAFRNKAYDPRPQNIPDVPDFWLGNKIFCNSLCRYAFIHCHISSLISISFTTYHNINHWFIHLLHIFFVMNVAKMWQGNIVLRNISGVTDGVHWVRLQRPREKGTLSKWIQKMKFSVLPHFNFWLATEKCYYVFILTGCQNNS